MTAKRSYESTSVPISKSQTELRTLLVKFGAGQFSFGEGHDWAGVEFLHADHLVRVRCPLRTPPDDVEAAISELARTTRQARAKVAATFAEREAMRVWRVLVWTVKARLVAVDEGLETFEQSFLAHIVDPSTNRTVWQALQDPIEKGALRRGGDGLRAIGRGAD